MFTCHVCGSHEAEKKEISQLFDIDDEAILVDHIPATVCIQCGEVIFDIDTAEHIRVLLHDGNKPTRIAEIPAYDFA